MRSLFAFVLFISAQAFASEVVTSRIHSIDIDQYGNEHFIQLESGEVVFVDQLDMIEDIAQNSQQRFLDIGLDSQRNIVQWRPSSRVEVLNSLETSTQLTVSPDFMPTVTRGHATLNSMFTGMRTDTKWRSQCFHRAYIWAYEEYVKSRRLMSKHFIFFTRKYIRENRYKWWFHVAPSTLFEREDGIKEFMVLDRTFMKGPVTVKEWTDKFIYSKRECPVVFKYTEYANNQEVEDCYLMPTSPYQLQPLDMENFEKTGLDKKEFVRGDLNLSYGRGFSGDRL